MEFVEQLSPLCPTHNISVPGTLLLRNVLPSDSSLLLHLLDPKFTRRAVCWFGVAICAGNPSSLPRHVIASSHNPSNARDEARRVAGFQHAADAPSRRRLQHACSTVSPSSAAWLRLARPQRQRALAW